MASDRVWGSLETPIHASGTEVCEPGYSRVSSAAVVSCRSQTPSQTPRFGRERHSASRVSESLSACCVRGDHLDDQLSDPTRLLVEREVARVGDRHDGHVRALLERGPLVVG